MTQLNLFDLSATSTADSTTTTIVATSPASYCVPAPAAKTETRPTRRRRRRKGNAAQTSSQNQVEGVQRMGDLARLVVMRYEMAAKQRALVAQRRANLEAKRQAKQELQTVKG